MMIEIEELSRFFYTVELGVCPNGDSVLGSVELEPRIGQSFSGYFVSVCKPIWIAHAFTSHRG
jgi:hypothetical protein